MHKDGEEKIRSRQKRGVFPTASGGTAPVENKGNTESRICAHRCIEPFNVIYSSHPAVLVGHASIGECMIRFEQDRGYYNIDCPYQSRHVALVPTASKPIGALSPQIASSHRRIEPRKPLGFLRDSKAVISSKRRLYELAREQKIWPRKPNAGIPWVMITVAKMDLTGIGPGGQTKYTAFSSHSRVPHGRGQDSETRLGRAKRPTITPPRDFRLHARIACRAHDLIVVLQALHILQISDWELHARRILDRRLQQREKTVQEKETKGYVWHFTVQSAWYQESILLRESLDEARIEAAKAAHQYCVATARVERWGGAAPGSWIYGAVVSYRELGAGARSTTAQGGCQGRRWKTRWFLGIHGQLKMHTAREVSPMKFLAKRGGASAKKGGEYRRTRCPLLRGAVGRARDEGKQLCESRRLRKYYTAGGARQRNGEQNDMVDEARHGREPCLRFCHVPVAPLNTEIYKNITELLPPNSKVSSGGP
ncbi:hypothetical protein H4582DRAFT_2132320 [Lactarius indigo]|nr:hypothetical protein H4582DRAFT_2132320 [Lactarius indigo]